MGSVRNMFEASKDTFMKAIDYVLSVLPFAIFITFLTKHKFTLRQKLERAGVSVALGVVVMYTCEYFMNPADFVALRGALSAGVGLIGADVYEIISLTAEEAKKKLPKELVDKLYDKINK